MADIVSARRAALTSAISEASAPAAAAPAAAPAPAPAPAAAPAAAPASTPASAAPPSPSPDRARDEAGRFKGKDPAPGEVADPPAAESKPQPTAPKYRPPQSWRPERREKFSTLPEDIQEEIDRVERAAADRIRKAAEAEKGYATLRQSLTPYEQHLRALGKPVPEALSDAMRLMVSVRSGTPQERAAALANLINESEQAGVGLDAINAILSQAPQAQAQPKPQEFRDPRFDQLMQQMAMRERQRTSQTVAEFAEKHEFFADVQDDIAGMIEAGIAKDLQSAYDYAIALPKHGEIRAILEQRKAAEAARTTQPAIERAQAAASSVRASPVAAAPAGPKSRREMLAAVLAKS